jgi:hypothetical protein
MNFLVWIRLAKGINPINIPQNTRIHRPFTLAPMSFWVLQYPGLGVQ